ncbi:2Fe-2S iron-sulfur cluster-binding protein [Aquimarina sp. AU474]|uniref:2Fe-2S iron-sulfur cluster-binding protein n=1 Tax=Aquimarina sp. AU474 TaxID=2108529 RepID=UPI0013586C50|nr:2Fe-2S iron-sulfur cluster-binding protein [Aquimarina sp. AU474]
MSITKPLYVKIIDLDNEIHKINFKPNEYSNLMELIINHYYEEIGDCGGRGLCGTCHVQPNQLIGYDIPDLQEIKTLDTLPGRSMSSRLACQIMTNERINKMTFKIINDN